MQKQIKDKPRLFSKLFVSATYTQKIQPPLIVSPHFLSLILNQAQNTPVKYQTSVINEILDLFVRRDVNSLLLHALDDCAVQVQTSLFDSIIMWMVRIVSTRDQAREYLSKIQYLLAYYQTSLKNLGKLTQWLSIFFYDEKFSHIKMNFILSVIKMYFGKKRGFSENPKHFFYIYGGQNHSGIKTVQHTPDLPVKNNIFISICFRHSMTVAYNNHNLFRLQTDKGQRLIAYVSKDKLVLGYKTQDQKQLHICQITSQVQPQKWYRLTVQYTYSSTLVKINNVFEEKLKPFISKNRERSLKQCNFGENFHGMMCSLFVANKAPKDQQYIYQDFPYGIESWESLSKLKKTSQFVESILFSCLPFSTFEVRYQLHCFDIFKRNHSVIGQNITVSKTYSLECGTSIYGGIKTIVPIFYLARFYNAEQYPTLLQELLQLLLTLINESPAEQIEVEVSKDNILLLLSQHISACPKLITVKVLYLIRQLDMHFRNDFNRVLSIKYMLWGISFRNVYNREIVNQHYAYIIQKYKANSQEFSLAQEAFSFTDIIYYMVKNFEDSASNCCLQHYMNQSILSEEFSIEEGVRLKKYTRQLHYAWVQAIAGEILENYLKQVSRSQQFNNSALKNNQNKIYENIISFIKSLLRLLLHKYSTCLYLTLLRILKHQVQKLKDNRKFLSLLANKCNLTLFLAYLSQKTINCDLLTDIVYLLLTVYKGSDRDSQGRTQVVNFLKSFFIRLGDFPKIRRNPALKAAKKRRKNSVNIDDRNTQVEVSQQEKQILNNPLLSHIYRPSQKIGLKPDSKSKFPFKSMSQNTRGIILEQIERPASRPWDELQQVTPQNIRTWMPLYLVLKNFTVGVLSDVQIHPALHLQGGQMVSTPNNDTFEKRSSWKIHNEDSIEILLNYYRICDVSIQQLILKDLLQNLMIDPSNLSFYRSSYHLNLLLIEAIGRQVNRSGVIGQMAVKIISSVFEQLLRKDDNIGDYFILVKSLVLLKKQFFVNLIYEVFNDLLSRKILSRDQLCHLLIIIEFQTLQSKITFISLTQLTILVVDQLADSIESYFQTLMTSSFKNLQSQKEKPLPIDSIEFLLCLHGKKEGASFPIFDSEVNTGIMQEEITFNFDNILSKILIDPNLAMMDLGKMVKRYHFFQAYIIAVKRVMWDIIHQNTPQEKEKLQSEPKLQELADNEINEYLMLKEKIEEVVRDRIYSQQDLTNLKTQNQFGSGFALRKAMGSFGSNKLKEQLFNLSYAVEMLQRLTEIMLIYINVKMCSENYTNNESVRMVVLMVSSLYLELFGIDKAYPERQKLAETAKKGFAKLWSYILKILGHFSKDKEVTNYEILYDKMLQLQMNGLFVELFQYFLKEPPEPLLSQSNSEFGCEQISVKISNGQTSANIIDVPQLKLIALSDKKIEEFVLSDRFKKSLMVHDNVERVLKQCYIKNNTYLKEGYLNKISNMKNKMGKQRGSLREIRDTDSPKKKMNSQNIQYLFDQQNTHEEEVRIKFLHQQERQLRRFHSVWRIMWRDMRIYHKPYGFWMAQKDSSNHYTFQKSKHRNFKFCMSKYSTTTGIQPILEAEIVQPWHIVKVYWKEKYKYVTSFTDMMRPSHSQKKKHNHLDLGPQMIKNLWKNLLKTGNILKNITSATTEVKHSKQYDVLWIQGSIKAKGKLFTRKEDIIFCYDGLQQEDSHLSFEKFVLPFHKQTYQIWKMPTIIKVSRRRYLMKYNAIQILLNNTRRLLFNFQKDDSTQFIAEIDKFRQAQIYAQGSKIKANKVHFYMDGWLKDVGVDEELTQLWVDGKISNLQYIVEVNNAACRSIYDLSQYLVVPWVVEMNTEKQPSLRDLSKTLGALGTSERKKILMEKYKSKDPFNPVPAFYYGTHYSSPGVIFNFLIRLSPFTQHCKHLQGGKFDIADRLFASFISAWKSAMTEVSDVRELIPQFYYLPECMINIEEHNLGQTQCGQTVNHIELPQWAAHSPYFFTIQMRQMLESSKVSESLSKWIDLIFGYKQKGKEAEQALNVYYYLTYEDYAKVGEEIEDDQVYRKSCEAQIVHFGQIPPQIFTKPHPSRMTKKVSLLEIGFVNKYLMMNSFKQKIVGISINGTDMRVVKRNVIESIALNREPAVLQKSTKFNFQRNSSEHYYLLKKEAARVVFFKSYFLIYGYLTNEFRIFNRSTGLVEDYGTVESTINFSFVNEDNDLILIGCESGILHIYEIVYDHNSSLIITKIGSEYFRAPINHISENQGFFAISFGNYAAIYKISRSVFYMFSNKQSGQAFIKFFRSFRSSLPIKSAHIISSPLYAIVLCDNANIKTYSINGQFIKSINVNTRNVGTLKDVDLHDLIYYVEDERVVMLSTPDLRSLSEMQIRDYLQIFGKYVVFKNWVGIIGRVEGNFKEP